MRKSLRSTFSLLGVMVLCMTLLGPAARSNPHPSDQLLAAEIQFYPRVVYPELISHVAFDLGVNPEFKKVKRIVVDCFGLVRECRGITYRDKDGRTRCCGTFEVPPDVTPGLYPVLVTIDYGPKGMIRITEEIDIKKKIPCGSEIAPPPHEDGAPILASPETCLPSGTRIKILNHGPDAFLTWKKMLSEAQHRINLQTYFLEDSGRSSELIEILKKKADQGVTVNLIVTRYSQMAKAPLVLMNLRKRGIQVILVGNTGFPDHASEDSQSWLERMRRNYRIVGSLPHTPAFKKWLAEKGTDLTVDFAPHEKMLIVDDKRAIVGGRNISDSYFWWWIDVDVYLEGPAVRGVEQAFEGNWLEFGGTIAPLKDQMSTGVQTDKDIVQLVHSKPWYGRYPTLDMICRAISTARERIYITSQFLALPPRLEAAIAEATARGVDVRILTNSHETCKEVAFSLGHFISLNYYRKLLEDGVRLFEYRGSENHQERQPYIHAKQFIIDGRWLSIGSFNLSVRSAYLESEIMVNLEDEDLASGQEGLFLHLLSEANEITAIDLARQEDAHGLLMNLARRIEILY